MSELIRSYYFSFTATGHPGIDEILRAVARAGKAYHSTESWTDPDDDGTTQVGLIQDAADALRAALTKEVESGWVACSERLPDTPGEEYLCVWGDGSVSPLYWNGSHWAHLNMVDSHIGNSEIEYWASYSIIPPPPQQQGEGRETSLGDAEVSAQYDQNSPRNGGSA